MPGQTGPKLNADGRRLVVEWVIAGFTNSEIRNKLQDAGYDGGLSDNALGVYRQSEKVKEAISRKDMEAVQCGLSQRSERILRLARHAKRFERRLAMDNETLDFAPGNPLTLCGLSKEYRETLRDLGNLVDPKDTAPPPNATVEIVIGAAASADAKFSAHIRTAGGAVVLEQPDDDGEGGT